MYITDLLPHYDVAVPRYTSYPTAPHFSPGIGTDAYAAWLRDLPDAPVSLYLHVPFCAELCLFCGCHTSATHSTAPLEAYADTLLLEIDLLAVAIGRRLPVAHIHWGGGTPTAMPGPRMREIMAALRNRFDVLVDAEIAVEIDPRTCDDAVLDTLAAIGCTRASLGVQDFDAKVQQAVNRHQSAAVTQACADGLRVRGINAINLDLIYGLPYQTVASVTATVEQALAMRPERIAVFGYAHVPWMKKHQLLLPEREMADIFGRWEQQAAIERCLVAHGYVAIGLDHYALPEDALACAAADGTMRRNFQGYTTDVAPVLLGLGASSIGALPQGYVQNIPAIPAYRDQVRAGLLPIARGIALSEEDRLRRDVIEALMCHGRVDLDATAARHGRTAAGLLGAAPALDIMAQDGIVEWDGRNLLVPDAMRPFVRNVAAAFDTYFTPGAKRHARAV
ncbi:MAG: oxygen-independent coproporphyrinogen III oxidase [Alphaproteobacteria bacterium]|nr:oxygen-independent coproporphyrinogen III oxidase [Alphaproteobacteria bacterium]